MDKGLELGRTVNILEYLKIAVGRSEAQHGSRVSE